MRDPFRSSFQKTPRGEKINEGKKNRRREPTGFKGKGLRKTPSYYDSNCWRGEGINLSRESLKERKPLKSKKRGREKSSSCITRSRGVLGGLAQEFPQTIARTPGGAEKKGENRRALKQKCLTTTVLTSKFLKNGFPEA